MKKQLSGEDNFTYLTAALVLLLLLAALVDQFDIQAGQFLVQSTIVIVLGIGVWSLRDKGQWIRTRIGFVIAVILVTMAGIFFELAGLDVLWLLFVLAFLVMTTWLVMHQVLFTGQVDWNKIVGTICIFLLLGLIWTTLYMITKEVFPEAFNGIASDQWYENFPDLIYFSFVTLTTLGYGDVGPVAPLARFLATMEAMVGQFYIAIVVASMVGIRVSDELD